MSAGKCLVASLIISHTKGKAVWLSPDQAAQVAWVKCGISKLILSLHQSLILQGNQCVEALLVCNFDSAPLERFTSLELVTLEGCSEALGIVRAQEIHKSITDVAILWCTLTPGDVDEIIGVGEANRSDGLLNCFFPKAAWYVRDHHGCWWLGCGASAGAFCARISFVFIGALSSLPRLTWRWGRLVALHHWHCTQHPWARSLWGGQVFVDSLWCLHGDWRASMR